MKTVFTMATELKHSKSKADKKRADKLLKFYGKSQYMDHAINIYYYLCKRRIAQDFIMWR